MDENMNPIYINQLRRREPTLVIRAVGEPSTPMKSTLDPEILIWCEEHNFYGLNNDRLHALSFCASRTTQSIPCLNNHPDKIDKTNNHLETDNHQSHDE